MRYKSHTSHRFTCLLLAVLLASACTPKRPPVHEALTARETKQPVVFIPGISGSRLRDAKSGRLCWGNSWSLFFPHDAGYSLAVPIHSASAGENELRVDGAVREIRLLGLVKFEFYAPMIRMMEANGYRFGDLDDPQPEDNFFIFAHDWRYGNVRVAAELERKLENLRQVRDEDVLKLDMIGQSNASRIARYFIKYGGASLEDAEAGAAPPAKIHVDRLILVGTDNGGALPTLCVLNRGRKYVPLIGRWIRPEALFGYQSLYESIPAYREDVFFDSAGRSLDVDLFDADNWKLYGWGIYSPGVVQRLQKKDREDLFADAEQRSAFLTDALACALRLQRLLERDVEPFRTRYYFVQSDCKPTGDRALLVERDGEWHTWFAKDKPVKQNAELSILANAPGDGHASVKSQLWLSPQEKAAIVGTPVYVSEWHRKIIRHPETQRLILEFLTE